VLNILDDISENASTSAYMIESISLLPSRLGHVNVPYIKNTQFLGLDSNNINNVKYVLKLKQLRQQLIVIT